MKADHSTHTPAHLFVYGTLLFDEVLDALTGRAFRSIYATLPGFSRHAVVRQAGPATYPAIRPDPFSRVEGKVWLDVDKRSMKLIHAYENDPRDYERRTVEVEGAAGQLVKAVTYVALPSLHAFLVGDWDAEAFRRKHLNGYVRGLMPERRRASASPPTPAS